MNSKNETDDDGDHDDDHNNFDLDSNSDDDDSSSSTSSSSTRISRRRKRNKRSRSSIFINKSTRTVLNCSKNGSSSCNVTNLNATSTEMEPECTENDGKIMAMMNDEKEVENDDEQTNEDNKQQQLDFEVENQDYYYNENYNGYSKQQPQLQNDRKLNIVNDQHDDVANSNDHFNDNSNGSNHKQQSESNSVTTSATLPNEIIKKVIINNTILNEEEQQQKYDCTFSPNQTTKSTLFCHENNLLAIPSINNNYYLFDDYYSPYYYYFYQNTQSSSLTNSLDNHHRLSDILVSPSHDSIVEKKINQENQKSLPFSIDTASLSSNHNQPPTNCNSNQNPKESQNFSTKLNIDEQNDGTRKTQTQPETSTNQITKQNRILLQRCDPDSNNSEKNSGQKFETENPQSTTKRRRIKRPIWNNSTTTTTSSTNFCDKKCTSQTKNKQQNSSTNRGSSPMNICCPSSSPSSSLSTWFDDDNDHKKMMLTPTRSSSSSSSNMANNNPSVTTLDSIKNFCSTLPPATYDPSAYGVIEQPEQSEPPKEADDEPNKIFVGGLPWDTTEYDLEFYFSHFGKVTEINIKYDPLSCLTRGFCFVTFQSSETVDLILKKPIHMIKGKMIELKRAKFRPICKKVFVGGLDPRITEMDLRQYFSQYGTVVAIETPKDRLRNRKREFCFIIFETETAAERACLYPKQFIGHRLCDVKKAQPQPLCYQQKRMAQTAGLSDLSQTHLTKILLGESGRLMAPAAAAALLNGNGQSVMTDTSTNGSTMITPLNAATLLYYQTIPTTPLARLGSRMPAAATAAIPVAAVSARPLIGCYPYQLTTTTTVDQYQQPTQMIVPFTAQTVNSGNEISPTNSTSNSSPSSSEYYINYYAQSAAYYAAAAAAQQQQLILNSPRNETLNETIKTRITTIDETTSDQSSNGIIIGKPITFNNKEKHQNELQ